MSLSFEAMTLDEDHVKTKVRTPKRFFDHRRTAVTASLVDPVELSILEVHFTQEITDLIRGSRGKVWRILNGFCCLHGFLNNDNNLGIPGQMVTDPRDPPGWMITTILTTVAHRLSCRDLNPSPR